MATKVRSLSSASFAAALCLCLCFVLAAEAVGFVRPAAAMLHPLLSNNGEGTCYGMDVPNSQVCYPTRCYHLFTITQQGKLTPTPTAPSENAVQTSADNKFRCTVKTRAVYNGVPTSTHPAAVCKYAECSCVSGSVPVCEPGKLASCWTQTCP